jgi:hypothetical protein
MVDFASILNKKPEDVEEPKPYPVGTYLGAISSMPEQREQGTKDGDRAIIRFRLKGMMAKEDVDQEALTEQGDISSWPSFTYDIWVDTPQGEWQLRQFLTETLSIEGGRSFGSMLPEAVGKQLVFTLKHEMYTRDGKPQIATRVASVSAV